MSGTMSGFYRRFAAYRQRRRWERQVAMAIVLSRICSLDTLALAMDYWLARRQRGPFALLAGDTIDLSAPELLASLATRKPDPTEH